MISKVLFSSLRLDWQTPVWLYDKLNNEFHFDFDPCPHNPTFNGLEIDWGQVNYVNPPYGREIGKWIDKGILEREKRSATIVFLLPARTDTKWFQKLLNLKAEFRFIAGRLKFDDQKNSAPFPSVIVVLRGNKLGN